MSRNQTDTILLVDNDVITRSTIDLAHNMKFNVVAEGVENQNAVNRLKLLDCDIMQGYFFSRPALW